MDIADPGTRGNSGGGAERSADWRRDSIGWTDD